RYSKRIIWPPDPNRFDSPKTVAERQSSVVGYCIQMPPSTQSRHRATGLAHYPESVPDSRNCTVHFAFLPVVPDARRTGICLRMSGEFSLELAHHCPTASQLDLTFGAGVQRWASSRENSPDIRKHIPVRRAS